MTITDCGFWFCLLHVKTGCCKLHGDMIHGQELPVLAAEPPRVCSAATAHHRLLGIRPRVDRNAGIREAFLCRRERLSIFRLVNLCLRDDVQHCSAPRPDAFRASHETALYQSPKI